MSCVVVNYEHRHENSPENDENKSSEGERKSVDKM